MEVTFNGGPMAGKMMNIPSEPDAFEFPIYTTNGASNAVARYERIKKTHHYEFVGKEENKEVIPAPKQKSVIIKRTRIVLPKEKTEDTPIIKGHMEYDTKKGRYVVKKDE